MGLKNEVWSEKYRPQTFQEIVGIDTSIIQRFCENPNSMPHLLLHSKSPGTGKTTLAKVIVKTLNAECLYLNASDERTIDVVREKVKRYAQCMSNRNVPRFIFLDEADGMRGKGDDTQEALRTLMEQYPAKFILTCNNINRIIEPVQSRCVKLHLGLPEREEVKNHLINICKKEDLEFENDAVEKLVNINYPSIRDMINQLQLLSMNGRKVTINEVKKHEEISEGLFNLIKSGKIEEARKEWIEKGLDLRDTLHDFFDLVWKDKLPFQTLKEAITLIAEADYRMAVGADKDIAMFWFCMKFRGLIK